MDALDSAGKHSDTQPESLILVGAIAGTHGLRGDVKVFPISDTPSRLLDLNRLFIGRLVNETRCYRVVAEPWFHRSKGKELLVFSLENVNSIDEAGQLKGQHVFVPEQDIPLAEDEIFLDDLVGYKAVSEQQEEIGTVRAIRSLPAHPLLVIDSPSGRELLIPAIPEFVSDIHHEHARVIIAVIDGLFD